MASTTVAKNNANKSGGGLTKINYLGYGLGDFGECMTFAIMGSFLTPYYTDEIGRAHV